MKSVRLQLLLTLAAILTAAGLFAAKGLLPEESFWSAISHRNVQQVQRNLRWGASDGSVTQEHIQLALRSLTYVADPQLYVHQDRTCAVVSLLLAHGADVNQADDRGETPLHAAVKCGYLHLVPMLLHAGADPNVVDREGNMPLHLAARSVFTKLCVKLLVAAHADVNAKNNDGETPLQLVVRRGDTELAEFLRQHGAKE